MYFLRQFEDEAKSILPSCEADNRLTPQKIQQLYLKLLLYSSKQLYGTDSFLFERKNDGAVANDPYFGAGITNLEICSGPEKEKAKILNNNVQNGLSKMLKYVQVSAAPSAMTANFLAQTVVCGCEKLFESQNVKIALTLEDKFVDRMLEYLQKNFQHRKEDAATISLDCIFSILLELNQREPELTVKALQNLSQFLQNFKPASLFGQSRETFSRMLEVLAELRLEGNTNVAAYATSCMISLSLAYGHAEFIFSTARCLICVSKKNVPFNHTSNDFNIIPKNLQSFCQSATKQLSNQKYRNWWSKPLNSFAKICEIDLTSTTNLLAFSSFECNETEEDSSKNDFGASIVSDGAFIYLLTKHGLIKMATGLLETKYGEVLICNDALKFNKGSALLINNGSLFLRRKNSSRLIVLDTETLREIGIIDSIPAMLQDPSSILYSDGLRFYHAAFDSQSWNLVCTALDEDFAPLEVSPSTQQPPITMENQFLLQQSIIRSVEIDFQVFGNVSALQTEIIRSIPTELKAAAIDLQFGQDVVFLLTRAGKIYYRGQGIALFGLVSRKNSWKQLRIPEQIISIAVDNEHHICCFRSGAGSLWILGPKQHNEVDDLERNNLGQRQISTAKIRESNASLRKIRFQNRRKCISMSVTDGGCIACTLDNGRCYIYGRHILNGPKPSLICPVRDKLIEDGPLASHVTGLEGIAVVQIGIAKTHLVVISKNGAMYTTGMNNMNQCGRITSLDVKEELKPKNIASTAAIAKSSTPSTSSSSSQNYCNHLAHVFCEDIASLCSRCGKCSVKNDRCSFSKVLPYSPNHTFLGSPCPCQLPGRSCCLRCGLCERCANSVNLQRIHEAKGTNLVDNNILSESSSPVIPSPTFKIGCEEQKLLRLLPPGTVTLSKQYQPKISSISVGQFHTIVFCADNSVFTFGSNSYGQLGTGDTQKRNTPYKLQLPANIHIVQAVAGANHCVLRTLDGRLITFGSNKFGQLGRRRLARPAGEENRQWFAEPGFVSGFGQSSGRIGDVTIVQFERQLIEKNQLSDYRITANQNCMLVIPASIKNDGKASDRKSTYIVIRREGVGHLSLRHFTLEADDLIFRSSLCFDPKHSNLLWGFDHNNFKVFALNNLMELNKDSQQNQEDRLHLNEYRHLLLSSTELMLPSQIDSNSRFSDFQLSIYLLSSITSMIVWEIELNKKGKVPKNEPTETEAADLLCEDFNECESESEQDPPLISDAEIRCVNRFQQFGVGWGYAANSVESIQFKVDKDILFCGIGLFGGRGEYVARLKLYSVDGGGVNNEHFELVGETDQLIFTCQARKTASLQLAQAVSILKNQWYVIWVQILGPSSDAGAGGKSVIVSNTAAVGSDIGADESVEFNFRDSPLSNNGTDTQVGQIPELYFKLIDFDKRNRAPQTDKNIQTSKKVFENKSVPVAFFLFDVNHQTLMHIIATLEWSFEQIFKKGNKCFTNSVELISNEDILLQDIDATWRQERVAFVAILLLRLLCVYFKVVARTEELDLANGQRFQHNNAELECLKQVLKNAFCGMQDLKIMTNKVFVLILNESFDAFIHVNNLFKPTSKGLGNLLTEYFNVSNGNTSNCNWWLLVLLSTLIRIDLPVLEVFKFVKNDVQRDFNEKRESQVEDRSSTQLNSSQQIALQFLFNLAFAQITNIENSEKERLLQLLKFTSQEIIIKIAREYVHSEIKHLTNECANEILQTQNRFRRIASATWEIGDPAQDAIAFQLDSENSNVFLHGVGIYLDAQNESKWKKPFSCHLEVLKAVKDLAEDENSWRLIDSVTVRPTYSNIHQKSEQLKSTTINLTRPVKIFPKTYYALKVQMSGGSGKTFYGENGVSSLLLKNGSNITFHPCSFSRNGTTTYRGQIPYLVYSFDKKNSLNRTTKDEAVNINLDYRRFEPSERKNPNEPDQRNPFLQILRLMVQKISTQVTFCQTRGNYSGILDSNEQSFCSFLIGITASYLEHFPTMSFEVMSVINEIVPIITSINNARQTTPSIMRDSDTSVSTGTLTSSMHGSSLNEFCTSNPVIVECPHPYKSGQIYSERVKFSNEIGFMSIRFDSQCQGANFSDSLWIYAALDVHTTLEEKDDNQQQTIYFPIAKFSGHNWPGTSQLLVPGYKAWFLFETFPHSQKGSILPKGKNDDESCSKFGYKCTIEGIKMLPIGDISHPLSSKASDLRIEQEFILLCATACRLLAEFSEENGPDELHSNIRSETIALLRRGLSLTANIIPTLKEVLYGIEKIGTDKCSEFELLKEFIDASPETLGGSLANAIVLRPFICWENCQIQLQPMNEGKIVIGETATLCLILRDQFNHKAWIVPSVNLQVKIINDGSDSNESRKIEHGSPLWEAGLKSLQEAETYEVTKIGKAIYRCIAMRAPFSEFSLEELRFAFLHQAIANTVLMLEPPSDQSTPAVDSEKTQKNCHIFSQFLTSWTPKKSGRYKIQVVVDGIETNVSANCVEVIDERKISESMEPGVDNKIHSPKKLTPATQDYARKKNKLLTIKPTSRDLNGLEKRAIFSSLSPFAAIRIRAYPMLDSAVLGEITRGSSISYSYSIQNDDGIWLQLTNESKFLFLDHQFRNSMAWCLQYTSHMQIEYLQLCCQPSSSTSSITIGEEQRSLKTTISILESPKFKKRQKKMLTRCQTNSVISEEIDETKERQEKCKWDEHIALLPSTLRVIRSIFVAVVWHGSEFDEVNCSTISQAASQLKRDKNLVPILQRLTSEVSNIPHNDEAATFLERLNYYLPSYSTTVPTSIQKTLNLWYKIMIFTESFIQRKQFPNQLPNVDNLHQPMDALNGNQLNVNNNTKAEIKSLRGQYELSKAMTSQEYAYMRKVHPDYGSDGARYNGAACNATARFGNCRDEGIALSPRQPFLPPVYERATAENNFSLIENDPAEIRISERQQIEDELFRNALFLLELNGGIPPKKPHTERANQTPWRVDMFPRTSVFRSRKDFVLHKNKLPGNFEYAEQYRIQGGHSLLSDPGCTFASPSSLNDIKIEAFSTSEQFSSHSVFADLYGKLIGAKGCEEHKGREDMEEQENLAIQFIIKNMNLDKIRKLMRLSIGRAVKLLHVLHVWNWLLNQATSESSIMDILWQHLTLFESYRTFVSPPLTSTCLENNQIHILPHPINICKLVGTQINIQLINEFHAFLSNLPTLLQSPEVGIRLKCMCFRALTFQLTNNEQNLLLILCNIIVTVGNILSSSKILPHENLSDEGNDKKDIVESSFDGNTTALSTERLEPMSDYVILESSSHSQLLRNLLDRSFETFWESAEEDNLCTIKLKWQKCPFLPKFLGIFIDNVRDEKYCIDRIIIKTDMKEQSGNVTFTEAEIQQDFVGWKKYCIHLLGSDMEIELQGGKSSCRLRQLVILGEHIEEIDGNVNRNFSPQTRTIKPSNSHQLLFNTIQADAFELFQSIAVQAFSDNFSEKQNESLRQQVMDVLFSRTQLEPLQSFVCNQIATAIEREVASLFWSNKRNYSYVCALITMIVRICKHRPNVEELFSHRSRFFVALSELILVAPDIVRNQAIQSIESIAVHFSPYFVDSGTFVRNCLMAISKAIILQVKYRTSRQVKAFTIEEHLSNVPDVWALDRKISTEAAQSIIALLQKLSSVSASIDDRSWSFAVQSEVANILLGISSVLSENLTLQSPENISSPNFWLVLSALAVIKDEKWLEKGKDYDRLKTRKEKPRPFCENHDDGKTPALVDCKTCQLNLCLECNQILHLNRRNKGHQCQRLQSTADICPEIEIHDTFNRIRIGDDRFIMLNRTRLIAVVEMNNCLEPTKYDQLRSKLGIEGIESGDSARSPRLQLLSTDNFCRFCKCALEGKRDCNGTCTECSKFGTEACTNIFDCGHWCAGIKDELECLPCFQCKLFDYKQNGQDASDACAICFTDRLDEAPCVRLKCGHLFHFICVRTVLERRWSGPRILFRFMQCPLCRKEIDHPAFSDILHPLVELQNDVIQKTRLRLEYNKNQPRVSNDHFDHLTEEEQLNAALDRFMYFLCSRCGKAYFGGETRCFSELEDLDDNDYKKDELVCGGCIAITRDQEVCGRHGTDFLEFKCRFCCSLAVYFCFGTSHFCAGCHTEFKRLMAAPKNLLPKCPVAPRSIPLNVGGKCPLGISHPPTGEEFALGCGICRNIQAF